MLGNTQIVTIAIYWGIFLVIDNTIKHQKKAPCFPVTLRINHLQKKFHVKHFSHSVKRSSYPAHVVTVHMLSLYVHMFCCCYGAVTEKKDSCPLDRAGSLGVG
jgi:hypothetical protein